MELELYQISKYVLPFSVSLMNSITPIPVDFFGATSINPSAFSWILDEKEKQIHSLQKALKEYTDMPDDLACGRDYYKIAGMKEVYNGTDGYDALSLKFSSNSRFSSSLFSTGKLYGSSWRNAKTVKCQIYTGRNGNVFCF